VKHDVDRLDRGAVPRRFEQVVGESEVQDALQHLLGQIVIDPIDLLLVKQAGKQLIQRARAVRVAAEGLLHKHAGPPGQVVARLGEATCGQSPEDRLVVLGRNRQIEQLVRAHTPLRVDQAQVFRERFICRLVLECALGVREHAEELLGGVRIGIRIALGHDVFDPSAQIVVGPWAT